MTSFKALFVLTSVVVATLAFEDNMYDLDDSVAFLQAAMEEKIAVKKAFASLKEPASEYNLPNNLACESKAEVPAAFMELTPPTATIQEQIMSVRLTPELDGGDPPGAGTLRAVLALMIIALFFDGIRRWRLQKQESASPQQTVVKKTLAQEQAEAAEEAAWVQMVTAASTANNANFDKAIVKNPSVTRTDTWGCSPLHFAAAGGSAAIATQLLKLGADIDVRDASEETPLHFAARAGHGPICDLLLEAGANIDAVNVQDMTPFVLAGHANQEPTCRLLADRGAGVAGLLDTQLPPLVVSQLVRKMFGA